MYAPTNDYHLDLFERGYWDKSTPRARRQPKKRARQLEQAVIRAESPRRLRTERWI